MKLEPITRTPGELLPPMRSLRLKQIVKRWDQTNIAVTPEWRNGLIVVSVN